MKIGQQCALIDPLPFQVVVDEDEADVRTSKAQLTKDKAATANARVVYERDKKLRDQGIVSQETLDADKSALDQDVATIDLDVATIAAKQAALHAAQVNLGYTNIVSPVNGTVITRYIDVGYTVVSSLQSSTLFLIGKDMTSMQVDTNVSEADVGEVHDGQKANFTVQAYPNRMFEATVRQVRKGPITVQNVVTYDVVLDVQNQDLALLPGMTSDTHIVTAERKNVLRVPLPATRFVPEGMGRPGRGTGEGRGGNGSAGAGGRSGPGGAELAQVGGDQGVGGTGAGVSGPGSTNDGLPGAGVPGAGAPSTGAPEPGASKAGAPGSDGPRAGSVGSGAAGPGDTNQQRHHRWNRDPNASGANGQGRGQRLARAQDSGDQAGPGEPGHSGDATHAGDAMHAPGQNGRGPGSSLDGGVSGRRARGPRAMARIWVLRNGQLTPVIVRTGLDDGTLIEISTEDLKEGDEVVVNAVRPNAPRPAAGERPPGQGQPNGGLAGGSAGFRL